MRRPGAGKKGLDRLVPDIQRRQNIQARIATSRVVNAVTEISPNYSGKFRTRWLADPIGNAAEPAQEGGFVPKLSQPKAGTDPQRGYSIRNESPYAAEAMDLEPGLFVKPKGVPEPDEADIVVRGIRDEGYTIRGDVDEDPEGGSVSTAERDWYENYARNQFAKDVRDGARSAVARVQR